MAMRATAGKRFSHLTIAVGVPVLLIAAYAARGKTFEWWYLRGLESDDFTARYRAALMLGALRSERAVPGLIALLRESGGHDGDARVAAGCPTSGVALVVSALRDIGPPALVRALRESGDEKTYWRRHAFRVLMDAGPEDASVPMTEFAEDGYLCLRLAALHALEGWDPELAVPALTRALEDESPLARRAAARALESIRRDGPGVAPAEPEPHGAASSALSLTEP